MNMNYFNRIFSFLFLATLISCGSDDTNNTNTPDAGGGEVVDDCDFSAILPDVLTNYADNVIKPNYADLEAKSTQLVTTHTSFITDKNEENLTALKTAVTALWLSYQKAAHHDFGPAETSFLVSINNFPLDTVAYNDQLNTGNIDITNPNDYDLGFAVLDKLLFEKTTAETLIALENDNASAYLSAVIEDIQNKVQATHQAWFVNGYDTDFKNNTGNGAGSSFSQLVNSINKNYELIKREKLGIPSGVLTLGFTYPDRLEGFHAGISKELLSTSIESSLAFFNEGLDDLVTTSAKTKNGQPLTLEIQEGYATAIAAINNLDNDIANQIKENSSVVVAAYNETVKNLVNLKTDMPSVLCIAITYVDNPSDSD